MIPAAARADSEYLAGAVGVRMSLKVEGEDEHPSSALRHSGVLRINHPPGDAIPEFEKAMEERPKVLAAMRGEEARDVLEENALGSVSLHKVEEGEGEAGAGGGGVGSVVAESHSCPLPGDGEVLAGEAAGPEAGGSSTAGAHPIPTPLPTLRLIDVSDEGAAGSWLPAVGSKTSGVLS